MTSEFGKHRSFVEDMARGEARAMVGYLGPVEADQHDVDTARYERVSVSPENLQRMQKFLSKTAIDNPGDSTRATAGRSPLNRFPPVSEAAFDDAWDRYVTDMPEEEARPGLRSNDDDSYLTPRERSDHA